MNKNLEIEIAKLKRQNRELQPNGDFEKQLATYKNFANTTITIYAKAVTDNRPELIEQHVIQYWQAWAEVRQPDPAIEVRIANPTALGIGQTDP